ncbi:hypothetical protein G7046_g7589 [Stylonectria norvegica]|nr:hypothetical protein G7046_g7589 [Stylonectria norvegica]
MMPRWSGGWILGVWLGGLQSTPEVNISGAKPIGSLPGPGVPKNPPPTPATNVAQAPRCQSSLSIAAPAVNPPSLQIPNTNTRPITRENPYLLPSTTNTPHSLINPRSLAAMAQDPRALLQKAQKSLQGAGSGFSFFGGREDKYQTAADLFIEAANAFKMQKLNVDAGKAFEQAAQIQTKNLNEPDDAANTLVDAFKAYRKDNPKDAVRCLNVAVDRYCAKGNFRRAASHKENLGEVFEMEMGDPKSALECYEAAASWYEGDNANALANKLWLKVADVAAIEGDYYKAIENYEKVAEMSITNNLMKYSVKDYLLKAGICHLAGGDLVDSQRALEKYSELDPTFAAQREHKLLVDLCEAVEAKSQEQFTDKLYQYDQVSKLDKWKTTLLVRVKNAIEEADDEFA